VEHIKGKPDFLTVLRARTVREWTLSATPYGSDSGGDKMLYKTLLALR